MSRRYHVHLPGLFYVATTVFVGLAAINQRNNLLFAVFALLLTALVISGLVSGIMMTRIRIQRTVEHRGGVGHPLILRYAVTNTSRYLPAFNLYLEERPLDDHGGWSKLMRPARSWIMHVGAGETVHGEAIYWPSRRGTARFNKARVSSTFPFGIIRKSVAFDQPRHALIHPRVERLLPRILRATQVDEQMGLAVHGTKPDPLGGDDYYGLREIRPGDSLRHIAWKRSAAMDQLVTIDRSRPAPPRLRVVVNLTLATEALRVDPDEPHDGRALEEEAIVLAASLIRLADEQGYEVGLTIVGMGDMPCPISSGHWHLENLLGTLARIDLDGRRLPSGALRPGVERAAQIVVHPDRVDAEIGRTDALHLTARQLQKLRVEKGSAA